MIRKIFSAKAARAQLDAAVEATVRAAVYLGAADGTLSEQEVEALVDGVRAVARSVAGDDYVREKVTVPRLMDLAREALHARAAKGDAAYLAEVAAALQGDFKRAALLVAWRVIAGDGAITPREEAAFHRLAGEVELDELERAALLSMARATTRRPEQPLDKAGRQALLALVGKGWADAFASLKEPGVEVRWSDAAVTHEQATGTLVRLDLDAVDRTLHLHVTDRHERGPHLIFFYGDALPALLEVVDRLKDTLSHEDVGPGLKQLVAVCPRAYREEHGRLLAATP